MFLAMHVFNFNEINACNSSHAPCRPAPPQHTGKKQQVSSWTGTTCRVGPFAVAANLLLPVHLSRPLLMYVMHGSSSEPETKQKPELEAGTAAVEGAKRVKC